jgi:hypothetical protein
VNSQGMLAQKSFEGVVTYEITYRAIHENATIEFLEKTYGYKEFMYYKKGFYKRIVVDRKGDTIRTTTFSPKEKRVYGSHFSLEDTLITYSSKDNIFKSYQTKEVKNNPILNYDVHGLQIDYKMKEEFVQFGVNTQQITYFFSKKIPIKAKHHKNQKEGFYDEIVTEHPYLILKVIDSDFFLRELTKTMIDIQWISIDDTFFEIDASMPLKGI